MKKVLAAAIGNCVHVAGVVNFLKIAEDEGFSTRFMGAAVPVRELIEAVLEEKPDIVGVSYRLTPSAVKPLLSELGAAIKENGLYHIRWLFGGTEPVCAAARECGIFEKVFDGTGGSDYTINTLRGRLIINQDRAYEDNITDRIRNSYPYPVIRHHFGLPSLEDTVEGIKVLAESDVLDVISIAPDQNAQEHFFEIDKADRSLDGAGGVPVRTREDFLRLYEASRYGNHPLLRCYSGTNNVLEFAQVLVETINNAWSAVPLCWYNVLDGRGPRDVIHSIAENQAAMKWHGERGIPVEVNESHHWSLRDAHDAVGVASAFLAAYNAKKMGVSNYISQYMFNVPPSISPSMDLAKMLAKIELIESLEDENFKTYRQVRAGLASFPSDLLAAKGQMSASIYLGMALKPHIVHVVGYCEAHHAANPDDIIESCRIAHGVIRNCLQGLPDMSCDLKVQFRKKQLMDDAACILDAIRDVYNGSGDPLSDPHSLAGAIVTGILDAPHLKGNRYACGELKTRVIDGACLAIDIKEDRVLTEKERIDRIIDGMDDSGELCKAN